VPSLWNTSAVAIAIVSFTFGGCEGATAQASLVGSRGEGSANGRAMALYRVVFTVEAGARI
jgi:hypothetical protein